MASHTFEILKENGQLVVMLNGEVNSEMDLTDPNIKHFINNKRAEIKYLKETSSVKVLGTCFLR